MLKQDVEIKDKETHRIFVMKRYKGEVDSKNRYL